MTVRPLRRVPFLSALLLALVVATAAPAQTADIKAARACRKATADKLTKLVSDTLKAVDGCHKTRNACRKDGACVIGPQR